MEYRVKLVVYILTVLLVKSLTNYKPVNVVLDKSSLFIWCKYASIKSLVVSVRVSLCSVILFYAKQKVYLKIN